MSKKAPLSAFSSIQITNATQYVEQQLMVMKAQLSEAQKEILILDVLQAIPKHLRKPKDRP